MKLSQTNKHSHVEVKLGRRTFISLVIRYTNITVRPILLRKHRFYSFSRFSFSLKFKTNVPVKLKLQHPPWAYPGHYLTVILAREGRNSNVALKGWGI